MASVQPSVLMSWKIKIMGISIGIVLNNVLVSMSSLCANNKVDNFMYVSHIFTTVKFFKEVTYLNGLGSSHFNPHSPSPREIL